MGIDNSAKLIVGTHYDDLPEDMREQFNEIDIYEWIDDSSDLTYASEWFDAGTEGMVVGIEVDPPPFPMTDKYIEELELAHTRAAFLLKTKVSTIITPDIW